MVLTKCFASEYIALPGTDFVPATEEVTMMCPPFCVMNSGRAAAIEFRTPLIYTHLLETEDTANDLLERMMPGMAKEAGATEELKAHDPMRWVGLMNCCKAQVEEIIFAKLIYN